MEKGQAEDLVLLIRWYAMAKDKKPEVLSEHVFTIPLRGDWKGARRVMRANRSVSKVRGFIMRNTRAKSVKISTKLNDSLWAGGAKRPPRSIRVKASVDSEGLASVKLPEEITLDEEKKKFLDNKKAADKKEPGKEEAKGETPAEKDDAKGGPIPEAGLKDSPGEPGKSATEPADKKGENDMKEEPSPEPDEK
jgi:large subunit ribosomal protein L31e